MAKTFAHAKKQRGEVKRGWYAVYYKGRNGKTAIKFTTNHDRAMRFRKTLKTAYAMHYFPNNHPGAKAYDTPEGRKYR